MSASLLPWAISFSCGAAVGKTAGAFEGTPDQYRERVVRILGLLRR